MGSMKRGKKGLVIISKKECETLQAAGFKFEKDLHKTTGGGKNKTYFATESEKVMEMLAKIRGLKG